MEIAIWIIAICEVVRAIQNIVPIVVQVRNSKNQENAYSEFVKSLKKTDREFINDLVKEWAEQGGDGRIHWICPKWDKAESEG